MGGFTANQITVGALVIAGRLRGRPDLLGQPVQDLPADDDHRLRGRRRGRARGGRHRRQPPGAQPAGRRPDRRSRRRGRPVPAGRRDAGRARAAGRHVRAIPVRPRRDHGSLLGLPRPRPDHRQPDRRRSRRTGSGSTGCSSRRWSCSGSRSSRWHSCAPRNTSWARDPATRWQAVRRPDRSGAVRAPSRQVPMRYSAS